MENKPISTPRYKIALIVLYIGPLPPYFPIWLESAKANPDVDFLFYTDQEIQIDAPNFRVTKTPLDDLRRRFERALNRPLQIPNGYKLCDYRPAYGVLFADELRGYDFWGHCDIDLVFGRIRHFLTDEILSAYDRFYAYGPLSVYRNCETMRHAFELPGSWFTLDEMFGPVHIGVDEYFGINRICLKNKIPWYTNIDFALLTNDSGSCLKINHRQPNYPAQTFYYLDGRAFQRYVDGEQVKERELAYIHWIQRSPVPERLPGPGEAVVVTADRLLVRPPEDLTPDNMRRWNPPALEKHGILYKIRSRIPEYALFFTGNWAFKKIWWKRKTFNLMERRLKKLPYP